MSGRSLHEWQVSFVDALAPVRFGMLAIVDSDPNVYFHITAQGSVRLAIKKNFICSEK